MDAEKLRVQLKLWKRSVGDLDLEVPGRDQIGSHRSTLHSHNFSSSYYKVKQVSKHTSLKESEALLLLICQVLILHHFSGLRLNWSKCPKGHFPSMISKAPSSVPIIFKCLSCGLSQTYYPWEVFLSEQLYQANHIHEDFSGSYSSIHPYYNIYWQFISQIFMYALRQTSKLQETRHQELPYTIHCLCPLFLQLPHI